MSNKWTRRRFLGTGSAGSFAAAASLSAGLAADKAEQGPAAAGPAPWFVPGDQPWRKLVSQPQYDIKFEFDAKVPLRDGVKLSANIWRPQAPGKFPIVLVYTPYDSTARGIIDQARYFASRGYAFVGIDLRGRYGAEGTAYLYWHTNWKEGRFEGEDVYDALTWLGERPWSAGKIAMQGPSYLAFVQWMVAYLGNPYLTALVPECSPGDHYNNVFPGGAFQLGNSCLFLTMLGGNKTRSDDLRLNFYDWQKLYRHLPLRTTDEVFLGKKVQVWQDFLDHPDHDEYWRFSVGNWPRVAEITPGKYPLVKVPSLNITGWYDQVQQDTINNYLGMVLYGPEDLRRKHQLIVGPWRHAAYIRKTGDLDFGAETDLDLRPLKLRWYDHWLKGNDTGLLAEPPVSIFAMGENRWRTEQEWPLSRAKDTKYYLHSAGKANSRFGDGHLSTTLPAGEPIDSFVYDPDDPVPTYGNIEPHQNYLVTDADGPRDRRAIQRRDDILVYTTPALEKPLEATGRILVKLYASSSARDTDFTAGLVDVHPNGYAQILADGVIRARYRNSFTKQELLTPGEVYEYTIDLQSISHVFQRGHKIQVEISSSSFPNYDRNPNTGHKLGEDAELVKAKQTIYHNSRYPSHMILAVVAS